MALADSCRKRVHEVRFQAKRPEVRGSHAAPKQGGPPAKVALAAEHDRS